MSTPPTRPVSKRHQSFPASAVFPGEDPKEFSVLFKQLWDQLTPVGPIEQSLVSTIAQLLWRKDRLGIFRAAEQARIEFGGYFEERDIEAGVIQVFNHRLHNLQARVKRHEATRETRQELKKLLLDMQQKGHSGQTDQQASRASAEPEPNKAELAKEEAEVQFAILGDLISPECLIQELELRELLDAAIERALERLTNCQARRVSGSIDRRRRRPWGSVRSC